jgi:hypothetical protein
MKYGSADPRSAQVPVERDDASAAFGALALLTKAQVAAEIALSVHHRVPRRPWISLARDPTWTDSTVLVRLHRQLLGLIDARRQPQLNRPTRPRALCRLLA